MIKAVIFDFYGVLNKEMAPNHELLDHIKNRLDGKYKLGIISNAIDDFMYQIVPEGEIKKIFDDITVSHSVGVAKPESAIYEISLRNLRVRADEAIFIDDIERFCEAAQGLGFRTIWYKDFPQMKKELEEILASSDN